MAKQLHIKVLDMQSTLDEILQKHASLVRFGDGEFDLIRGQGIPYQDYRPDLAKQMKAIILKGSQPNLLVGLPDVFERMKRYNLNCQRFYEQIFFPRNQKFLWEIEAKYNLYVSTFF